jgi:hypothetical protein
MIELYMLVVSYIFRANGNLKIGMKNKISIKFEICFFPCSTQNNLNSRICVCSLQTLPITEVGNRYRATEDMPICVDLDAYSRIRPVLGDGECFYRSFIFSYLVIVLFFFSLAHDVSLVI